MAATVYIARHGETEWNTEGRLQGRLGSALTPRGRAQARVLAQFAARVGVSRILTSPLERAVATARAVATTTRSPLERCDPLCEIDFGECGGLTLAQARARHPELFAARRIDAWQTAWPAGESYAGAWERLGHWLARTTPFENPGDTMIIAHESINRLLLMHLGRVGFAEARALRQPGHLVLRVDGSGRVAHALLRPPSDTLRLPWREGHVAAEPSL